MAPLPSQAPAPSPPGTWTVEPAPPGCVTVRRKEWRQTAVLSSGLHALMLLVLAAWYTPEKEKLGTLVTLLGSVPFMGLAGYLVLARKRLSIAGDRLVAVDRKLPSFRKREQILNLEDVLSVETAERRRGWTIAGSHPWELSAHLRSGKTLPLLTGLQSEEEARWLAALVQQALEGCPRS